MPYISEQAVWEDGVKLVEEGESVSGGPTGTVNLSLQDLANRTKYLKGALDDIDTAITALSTLVGTNKGLALLKASNLSDVQDKSAARSNLGVAEEGHKHDSDYLKKASNLSDVPDKSAALGNLDGISSSEKGAANGVAELGADGKVLSAQLPNLEYIPTDEKGAADGVADLDSNGKIKSDRIPNATPALIGGARIATDIEAYKLESNEVIMTPARMPGAMKAALSASGLAPIFACRAWVNFGIVSTSGSYSRSGYTATINITGHGLNAGDSVYLDFSYFSDSDGSYTVASVIDANTFTVTLSASRSGTGTVTAKRAAIAGSGNVSKVERLSTGYFRISFAKVMPHAGYAIAAFARDNDSTGDGMASQRSTDEISAERFVLRVISPDSTPLDPTLVTAMIIC